MAAVPNSQTAQKWIINVVMMTGQYGLDDVSLSTPCIVENCGVESALELHLNATEQKALEAFVTILQRAYSTLQPT